MRRMSVFIFGLALLFSLLPTYGCGSRADRPVIGRSAPNFTYRTLDGTTGELRDLRGKVVFLRFWADWCPYCAIEMPIIEQFYQQMKEKGLTILAINVKQPESVARAFVEKYRLSYPIVLDPEGKITEQYEVRGLPVNFIINREGVLKETLIGAVSDMKMLKEFLAPYLG